MALFPTFLLSNIDSSLLFNYRFPTLLICLIMFVVSDISKFNIIYEIHTQATQFKPSVLSAFDETTICR